MKEYIVSALWKILVGSLISIFVLSLCQNFITKYIVSEILSNMNLSDTSVKTTLILLFFLWSFYITKRTSKHIIPDIKFLIGISISVLIYSYYRVLPQNNWHFIKLFKWINYCDLIYLVFLVVILSEFYYIHQNREKIKQNNNDTSKYVKQFEELNDDSITTKDEDKLNFYPNAKILLQRITQSAIYYKNRAMCIGIPASWGSGKTSYLNLIEYAVEKDIYSSFYNKAIIVKFNPWFSLNSNTISHDFMSTLSKVLHEYNPNLSSELIHYSKLLSKVNLGWFSNLIDIITNNNENAIEKQFETISNCISLINKPIIIFIDDIDRLQFDEIMNVLQLIRNTANFKNTIFIVPYDNNYIINTMHNMNITEDYLEKIFTIPHPLPLTQNSKKNIIIAKKIKESFTTFNCEINVIKMFLDDINIHFSLRSINRLINQAKLTQIRLENIGLEDIYLYDLLLIEYLHLEHPEAYDLISNYKELLENNSNDIYTKAISHIKSNNYFMNPYEEFINLDFQEINKYKIIYNSKYQNYKLKNEYEYSIEFKIIQHIYNIENINKHLCPYRLLYKEIHEIYFAENTNIKILSQNEFNKIIINQPSLFALKLREWTKVYYLDIILRLISHTRFNNKKNAIILLYQYLEFIEDDVFKFSNRYHKPTLLGLEYYIKNINKEYDEMYCSCVLSFFKDKNRNNIKYMDQKFDLLISIYKLKDSNIKIHNLFHNSHITFSELYNLYFEEIIIGSNNLSNNLFNYIYYLDELNIYYKEEICKRIKEYIKDNIDLFIAYIYHSSKEKYKRILMPLFGNSSTFYIDEYRSFLDTNAYKINNKYLLRKHLEEINSYWKDYRPQKK